MKRKRIKQRIALSLVVLVMSVSMKPMLGYAGEVLREDVKSESQELSEKVVDTESVTDINPEMDMNLKSDMTQEIDMVEEEYIRLIVTSEIPIKDTYGAISCVKGDDNRYILTYADIVACERAYTSFVQEGITVEYDTLSAENGEDTIKQENVATVEAKENPLKENTSAKAFVSAMNSGTPQTINLTSDIVLTSPTIAYGNHVINGNNHTITYQLSNPDYEFLIKSATQVTLKMNNLTINAGGYANGGGYTIVGANASRIEATNVTVTGGAGSYNCFEAKSSSGVVAEIIAKNCTAQGAYMSLYGRTNISCINCKATGTNNSSFINASINGTMNLTSCTATTLTNEASSYGAYNEGTMNLKDCTFSNKTCGVKNEGTMTIASGCYVYSNRKEEIKNEVGANLKITAVTRLGFDKSEQNASRGAYAIDNNGTCNVLAKIKAYSSSQNGTLINRKNGTYYQSEGDFTNGATKNTTSAYVVRNYGKMNLAGGTFIGSSSAMLSSQFTNIVIRNYANTSGEGGKFVMNHASINGNGKSEGIRNYSNANYNNSWKQACIIRKGNIYNCTTALSNRAGTLYVKADQGDVYVQNNQSHGIYVAQGANLIVEDSLSYSSVIRNCGLDAFGKGNGVSNHGTATIKGGQYYNCERGIYNDGILNQIGGEIYKNSDFGVYQNGAYYMSGSASVDTSNEIYLCPQKVITVTGALTQKIAGKITLQDNDKVVGRTMINIFYDKTGKSDTTVENKFSLSFKTNARDINDYEIHTSAIRGGIRSGRKGMCILSGKYQITYRGNISQGLKVTVPKPTEFYWKEQTIAKTGSVATPYQINVEMKEKEDILNSLSFKGWSLKEDGSGKGYTTDQLVTLDRNTSYFAIWDIDFDLIYKGNGATEGEEFIVEHVTKDTRLAENPFAREEMIKRYDNNLEEEIDDIYCYSYQGWSGDKMARHDDENVYQVGDVADWSALLSEQITNGEAVLGKDGRYDVPIYAVWDAYPLIEAYDIYILDTETDTLTEEQLYKEVCARDKEDGVLENQVDVKVIDFDKEELLKLKHTGSVSITYQATDSVGNVSYQMVNIWVNASQANDNDIYQTRYINEEYYNSYKKEDFSIDTYKDYGGCHPQSSWYTNKDYKQAVTTAFSNMASDTPVQSWYVTHEQVLKTQDWIDDKGFAKENDKQGLKEWYATYAPKCRRK